MVAMKVGSMLTIGPGPPSRFLCTMAVFIYSILISILLILYMGFHVDSNAHSHDGSKSPRSQRTCSMTFTTAICGPIPPNKSMYKNWTIVQNGSNEIQLSHALVSIKSIALMSKFYKVKGQGQGQDQLTRDTDDGDCIEFIIFSDSNATFNQLESVLNEDESWRRVYRHLVRLTYMPVIYPKGFEDLLTMCKPCATVRLFLPQMLPNLTSILYLDTDTIFLTNPKKIWSEFDTFSEKNWGGMARDEYTFATNGYKEFYGKSGLGSGVLLLNLTRMRESQFLSQIRSTVAKFWKVIRGDQDILNIYFHYHSEEVKVLNCSQNYHYYSWQRSECRNLDIEILHGVGGTFIIKEKKDPFFRGIFQCFNKTAMSEINSTIYLHNTLTECIDKMRPTHNSASSRHLKTKNIIHITADS